MNILLIDLLLLIISCVNMNKKQISFSSPEKKIRRCLACGTDDIKPGRRYCSKRCRQKLVWSLSLSKGLLQTLNARYAAFSFTEHFVALDVMPVWSDSVSRFLYKRKLGYSPANTLKELTLEAGKEWYKKRARRISRSFASKTILEENVKSNIDPDSIKPKTKKVPKLSIDQKKSLKHLNIHTKTLMFEDSAREIKKAYREMAKIYHPDKGGDGDRFKEINRANELLHQWIEEPKFQFNNRLLGCWSYNSYTNRWSPPL